MPGALSVRRAGARDPVEFVLVVGDEETDRSRTQTWAYGALLAITLFGAYLRIESLHAAPLWLDPAAGTRSVMS